ncbi:MotB family protein [Labrenzia sp. R4_2]|uniref:MotB family protein n=1 Tax=Labrenzia sp. R4_2 TaxID=2821107 RepID=UPI001ADC65B5|nr:MotB family protein [Labrenzia sp. R4_2]MBO9422426.1 MotB family protein [Labrenzia sp. R4_2]
MDNMPNEIVIVRRRNNWDDDEKPHGVWKIAYADFMTALMAFFLVMWLINVTDESVRRGVAQYFNPVKLASTAPNRKGLNDPIVNGDTNENGTKLFTGKLGGTDEQESTLERSGEADVETEGVSASDADEIKATAGAQATSGEFTQSHPESILFTDPYAVLDTLAQKINVAQTMESNPEGIGSGLEKEQGALGGEAYRDPFDPQFWQFRPGRGVDGAAAETAGLPTRPGIGNGAGQSGEQTEGDKSWSAPFETDGTTELAQTESGTGPTSETGTASGDGPSELQGNSQNQIVAHVSRRDQETTVAAEAEGGAAEAESVPGARLISELMTVLEAAEGTLLENTAAQITVVRQDDGALISLTDDQNFGMFAIGSAEPRPELVSLLERLGKVISKTEAQIVITGHTDARPFKSKTYDNWRLSSARAHMALYMLSRGGVGSDRFVRIEGAADRHLKNAEDPFAASNRRVEIYLLEEVSE